jgi:beta-lactam-binding protein with PASTA domain
MLRYAVVVVLVGCVAPGAIGTTTSSTTTTSSSNPDDRASGAAPMTVITIPDVTNKTRAEVETTMRAAGVRGDIQVDSSTGDVDFAIARACNQNPGGGQQTSATLFVTVRYCVPDKAYVDPMIHLEGLDVAEATKRARAAGYTGDIIVQPAGNPANCKVGTVCSVDPERWNLNQSSRLTLWVNKALTIVTPD